MRQEEKLLIYKECAGIAPREEKIQEAVNRSKQVFFAAERERLLTTNFCWRSSKQSENGGGFCSSCCCWHCGQLWRPGRRNGICREVWV